MLPGVIERVGWCNTVVQIRACWNNPVRVVCGSNPSMMIFFLKDVFLLWVRILLRERGHTHIFCLRVAYTYTYALHVAIHTSTWHVTGLGEQSQGTAAPRAQQLQHSPALHIPLLTEHGAL